MTTILTDNDDTWAGWFDFNDSVLAGKGNDTLDGGGGNDDLLGQEGNDHLIGGKGDDVLSGDEASETGPNNVTDGDDTLEGGEGNDLLIGGGGNDVLIGGTGRDIMFGHKGDDVFYVDDADDRAIEDFNATDLIDAGIFNDVFSTGIDKVYSTMSFALGSGIENLTLQTAGGAINGFGNQLDNEIRGNGSANTLKGQDGDDHLYGNGGQDSLVGGDGNDFLYGGSDNDSLSGGADDDVLDGGSGADSMTGGDGNDGDYVDNIGDVASELFGSGNDTVYSTIDFTLGFGLEGLVLQGSAAIDGTGNSADNVIAGNDQDNTLKGMDGNDTLKGGGGADTLIGGRGDDHMEGGAGDDTYSVDSLGDEVVEAAGGGTDTVNAGNLAHYTLTANVENLNLSSALDGTGNDLDNVITGNLLDNVLEGLGGSDTLIGALGTDTAAYEHNSGRVIVTLVDGADGKAVEFATPTATVATSFDTLRGIENVTGSAFGDQITGNSLDNVLDGSGGADVMAGGNGNDTYIVDDVRDVVSEVAGQGTADRVQTSISYALASGSEVEFLETTDASGTKAINLIGNSFGNTITGNDGANSINGGGAADTSSALSGNDTYVVDNAGDVVIEAAGQGTDRVQASTSYVLTAGAEVEVLQTTNAAGTARIDLVGNAFDNTIIGNNGNNTLVGSPANDGGGYDGLDVFTGNGGGDVFVWSSTAESGVAGAEADVITDFNRAGGDLIAVNAIDANTLVAGDQAFTFVGQGPFTGAGQISFFTTATDTFILLNTDADAAQEMTIRLSGVHQVDAGFFVL